MDESVLPKYVAPSINIPSMDPSTALPPIDLDFVQNCVTRRFIFEESKIAELKTRVASTIVPKPSRVEANAALFWKCASAASRKNLGLPTRPSVMAQAVDIRKKMSPPLPETSVGNLFATIVVSTGEGELDLPRLVIQIRKAFGFSLHGEENAFSKILDAGKEYSKIASNDDIDLYLCSSWCWMSFYDLDFGWGKTIWFTIPSVRAKNSVVLNETSNGKALEALINLSAEDMAELESNEEFLEFVSINPRIA
ncbi:hypothetical protein L6164_037145 [Bauhinia variegata]|uniref:Uncharacterized protein n=1 Tax=Bauhinia variegata TaxID=167791 RepID=A0ACB9KJ13_BAUVA|nr:hypothetical protein L6164_037145 [Bauhinia variegata]